MNNKSADSNRRKLLTWLSISLGGISTALVGIPVISFILAPFVKKRTEVWRSVEPVENFEIGTTKEVNFDDAESTPWEGDFAETATWLQRRSEKEFAAYSTNRSHLGYPVRRVPESELFMCPCHGSVYYKDGKVAACPPPRGLTTYPVKVKNRHVLIKTAPVPII